jgi:hypothetical protein
MSDQRPSTPRSRARDVDDDPRSLLRQMLQSLLEQRAGLHHRRLNDVQALNLVRHVTDIEDLYCKEPEQGNCPMCFIRGTYITQCPNCGLNEVTRGNAIMLPFVTQSKCLINPKLLERALGQVQVMPETTWETERTYTEATNVLRSAHGNVLNAMLPVLSTDAINEVAQERISRQLIRADDKKVRLLHLLVQERWTEAAMFYMLNNIEIGTQEQLGAIREIVIPGLIYEE